MKQKIINFFASGFCISYIPTAILKGKKNTGAGFLGSLEAFLLYLFFAPSSNSAYFFMLLGIILFSIYISNKATFTTGPEDNPKIVIDEIAGFFVAVAFLPRTFTTALCALILFRIFDTTKISFIKKAEELGAKYPPETRKKYLLKGVEIVLDDVLAGLLANIILWALFLLNLF